MNDQFNQRNAAWRSAQQWRARAQSSSRWRGPKLFLAWLVFGVMMIIGLVVALVFLLVGWLAMPFLRRRMRKRTEEMRARAEQAARHGRGDTRRSRGNVIEGDYSVESNDGQSDPKR
ncbi:hypothetical protein [Marinimicrobium sp. ARAG 43.8]|uniref:hypothetical protein n=1 Tax=Marinimicrobium sp. ARAG 43.8 TaxID=3418719 RepID=UPI003CEA3B9B